MTLRKVTRADASRIADLLAQLDYPGTQAFIDDKIAELLAHPDEEIVVAEEKGRILGFISIHFIPQIAFRGSFARISYLCVDAAVRGKGIGRALEEYCVHAARGRGCDRIELHSHSRRQRAHAFYFRQGYEESPKYLMKRLG
jgi:GNAT superfamily N-acetyltransferase